MLVLLKNNQYDEYDKNTIRSLCIMCRLDIPSPTQLDIFIDEINHNTMMIEHFDSTLYSLGTADCVRSGGVT